MDSGGKIPETSFIEISLVVPLFCKETKNYIYEMDSGGKRTETSFMEIRLVVRLFCKGTKNYIYEIDSGGEIPETSFMEIRLVVTSSQSSRLSFHKVRKCNNMRTYCSNTM
jgi:hypothetical protein